jgi:DNA-binding Lrp family transcriptional regulator
VRSPAQIRALSSPVRQEIVDAIEAAGPSTIAEVAASLGRRPDALYFHTRELEKVGLLRRVGTRGEGRSAAAVFDLPVRPLRLDYATARGRAARLGPALDALLRLARRDTRRALYAAEAVADGPGRDLWVARFRGRVTPSDLARINALLEECAGILRESRTGPDARPVALAFALTPLTPLDPTDGTRPTKE